MEKALINAFEIVTEKAIKIEKNRVLVNDADAIQKRIGLLAEKAALSKEPESAYARYLIRTIAAQLGIFPASINDLYLARGRGEVPNTFSVPAMNLRVMSFDAAQAVFRAALKMGAAALIFEIARSEMGYTDQRPSEYASSILAAAISTGYRGPVFIQGDHFQVSAKKYEKSPETEINGLNELIDDAIQAGFYNIDIDTSTLVDLTKQTIDEQQKMNYELSAKFTAYIRGKEPKGLRISIGGEIGEVGGHNSTREELRAYLSGYNKRLKDYGSDLLGLSKISVQTGTSHGGVVLPDGSIAKVNVDFDTLKNLSRVARNEYGLGGTVQHGASTLPETAFSKFLEYEACEVHLATNFTNIFFDLIPSELKSKMYKYLDENYTNERKPDMTNEQFYYKTRKNVIGPFKALSWKLPEADKQRIIKAWELQFTKLFTSLGIAGTKEYVQRFIAPFEVSIHEDGFIKGKKTDKDAQDLAD
jgi:fructose/tagatose bisphosphate aldolase